MDNNRLNKSSSLTKHSNYNPQISYSTNLPLSNNQQSYLNLNLKYMPPTNA